MSTTANIAPSPIPPWQRPVESPNTQTLTEAGAVSLNSDTTYLDAADGATGEPFTITIAGGNYRRQIKRIYVQASRLTTGTSDWHLTGTFVGFTSLTFNSVGTSVVLEWDGTGWHMIGGNAVKVA